MFKQNIFLIGPMGAGKTSVGKKLASLLGYNFYDSDHEVEKLANNPISIIFRNQGEKKFRNLERQAIKNIILKRSLKQYIVLSTGGGAILAPENRFYLSSHGLVIYLSASIETQLQRVATTDRPLVKNIQNLMAVRDKLYTSIANEIINTDFDSVNNLSVELFKKITNATTDIRDIL